MIKRFFKRKKNNPSSSEEYKKQPAISTAPKKTQQIFRGPKNLFSENLKFNLNQIFKRLADKNLVSEEFIIGTRSKTKVIILYLKDRAHPDLVDEVKKRLTVINTEIVLDASYIERNIQDSQLSPFPQLELTSRPDVTIASLVQGRIAIFTEGTTNILLAPTTLFDLLDTPDDAYRRWFIASSFFRLTRFILLLMATFLPGFYIALTSFNVELIPTVLNFTINAAREGTPFPIYLEIFIMMGVVEAVRMVMLRHPPIMGQTIALFAGLTLVIAGLASNIVGGPVVVIATLTIIASFAIPNFDLRSSIRIIQFFTMVMATLLGLFGLAISFFYITIHLVTLKSFGIPYLAPLAPLEGSGIGHTVLRKNTVTMPRDETYQPLKNKGDNID